MIKASEARALCTAAEYQLVQASLPKSVKRLSAAQLRSKVSRSRKLRDKYRDLARRQRIEARGKGQPRGSRPAQSNKNTVRKAELFDETLTRFEQQLQRVEADVAKSSDGAKKQAKRPPGKKTPLARPKAAKKATKKAAKKKAAPSKAPPVDEATEGSSKPAPAKRPAPPKRPVARPTKAKRAAAMRNAPANAAAKETRIRKSGQRKVQAHVAAAGRRKQARRDAR